MKLHTSARVVLSLLVVFLVVFTVIFHGDNAAVRATTSDGFACTDAQGKAVFFQSRNNGVSTNISTIGSPTSTNPFSAQSVVLSGAATSSGEITGGANGLAYDAATGYLYVKQIGTNNLLRINKYGEVTTIPIAGLSTTSMQGATMTSDGKYLGIYLTTDHNPTSYVIVDPVAQTVSAPQNLTTSDVGITRDDLGDMAIDPKNPNIIYVSTGTVYTGAPYLSKIDIANKTIQVVGELRDGGGVRRGLGSLFFDQDGSLYGYADGGAFYAVDITTGVETLKTAFAGAGSSDGASCAFTMPHALDTTKHLVSTTQDSVDPKKFTIVYDIGVKNTSGNKLILPNVQLSDNLALTFADGSPTVVAGAPSRQSGNCSPNAGFNGTSDFSLLTGTDSFSDGESCVLRLTATVTYDTTTTVPTGDQNNTVYATSVEGNSNGGYTFAGNNPVEPTGYIVAKDVSTDVANVTTFPPAPNGDTPKPTPVSFAPNLTVHKAVAFAVGGDKGVPNEVNPGDTLTYTVLYQNTGTGTATGFMATDIAPSNTTYVSGSLAVNSSVGQTSAKSTTYDGTTTKRELLASPVAFAPGATITVTFAVTVDAGYSGQITNQAIATATNSTDVASDAVDNTNTNCIPPSGMDVTGSIAQGSSNCNAASVDPTVVLVVAHPAIMVYKSVKLTGDVGGDGQVNPGDTLTYTVFYKNTGDGVATNFMANDTISTDTTFAGNLNIDTTSTLTGATTNATFNGGTDKKLLASAVSFAPNKTLILSFDVTVNQSYTNPIKNQATATGSNFTIGTSSAVDNAGTTGHCPATGVTVPTGSIDQTTTCGGSNKETIVTVVVPEITVYKSVKLKTTKSVNNEVNPGDTLTYTVFYKNTGDGVATNFMANDTISTDTTFAGNLNIDTTSTLTGATTNATFNGGTDKKLLASAVSFAPNKTLILSFDVTVNQSYTNPIKNQATATGSNFTEVVSAAVDSGNTGNCPAKNSLIVPEGSILQTCTANGSNPTVVTVKTPDTIAPQTSITPQIAPQTSITPQIAPQTSITPQTPKSESDSDTKLLVTGTTTNTVFGVACQIVAFGLLVAALRKKVFSLKR